MRLFPLLHGVALPGRYVGGEWNAVIKDPRRDPVAFRTVLCFPDVYEVGMSHLGLIILYHILNEIEGQSAERCFAPWPDMAAALEHDKIPLLSLETATPLKDFDMVGFSLQHELVLSNVLYMLELAGIPPEREKRREEDPIVAAGGFTALSPEPISGAVDLFIVGDGEEALPAVTDLLLRTKKEGLRREERILEAARAFPFVYAPAYYKARPPAEGGRGESIVPFKKGLRETIAPAAVLDLDGAYFPTAPVLPGIRAVHDRISLEIMRGCTQGCRFCQAGMTKRPLRSRRPETLISLAEETYSNTGCDEIGLLSLSSSDYPGIEDLMIALNERFGPRRVGLSLPSLRIDPRLERLPELATLVRRSGLTLAPEVASDSLRRRINKTITNEDLIAGAAKSFDLGFKTVKMYFMIGLPGETEEDVRAIGRLVKEVATLRGASGKGPAKVNVSISTFIPKSHTPFQWCAMAREEEIREKRSLLYGMGLPRKIRFKFHDFRMSFVEGVLSRGGRKVFTALREARRRGCSFDAWRERIDLPAWKRAFAAAGVDPEEELHRERGGDEPFPWDHIDPGPSREFLRREWERARAGETTPRCGEGRCNFCGLDPKVCREVEPRP